MIFLHTAFGDGITFFVKDQTCVTVSEDFCQTFKSARSEQTVMILGYTFLTIKRLKKKKDLIIT